MYIFCSLILAACLIRNVVKPTAIKTVRDTLDSVLVTYVANVSKIYVNGLDRYVLKVGGPLEQHFWERRQRK
jgi:hypothetical protein